MSADAHEGQPPKAGATAHGSGGNLASTLAPALVQACDGRLSEIEWFKATWQSGGASTGYTTFTDENGAQRPAIVKLPVGPREYRWTTGLGLGPESLEDDAPVPQVYAAGTSLGGYDLAWVVIERLQGAPLSKSFDKQGVRDLLDAVADWYLRAAEAWPVEGDPVHADWEKLLATARTAVKDSGMPDAQQWNQAVHNVQRALPKLLSIWDTRPIHTWCHGDLHPGNAMRRAGADDELGRCVLIDLALVHPGHWVEDAIYLERLYWGRKELLHGVKPVSHIARRLKASGATIEEDYARLATVRRVLMGGCVPAFLAREGDPTYLKGALTAIESGLQILS